MLWLHNDIKTTDIQAGLSSWTIHWLRVSCVQTMAEVVKNRSAVSLCLPCVMQVDCSWEKVWWWSLWQGPSLWWFLLWAAVNGGSLEWISCRSALSCSAVQSDTGPVLSAAHCITTHTATGEYNLLQDLFSLLYTLSLHILVIFSLLYRHTGAYSLIQDLFSLLHTASPHIQRWVSAAWCQFFYLLCTASPCRGRQVLMRPDGLFSDRGDIPSRAARRQAPGAGQPAVGAGPAPHGLQHRQRCHQGGRGRLIRSQQALHPGRLPGLHRQGPGGADQDQAGGGRQAAGDPQPGPAHVTGERGQVRICQLREGGQLSTWTSSCPRWGFASWGGGGRRGVGSSQPGPVHDPGERGQVRICPLEEIGGGGGGRWPSVWTSSCPRRERSHLRIWLTGGGGGRVAGDPQAGHAHVPGGRGLVVSAFYRGGGGGGSWN